MLLKYINIFMVMICFVFGARPFGTDDAGTVASGAYELETGFDFWKEQGVLGIGFKHGITERMDIGIGFGFNVVSEPKNSFTISEFSFKWAIVPELFSTSFCAEIGGSSYNINSIFTRCLGPIEIDANFGFVTGDTSITYAGAVIYNLTNLTIGGEVCGDKESQFWLFGGRYTVTEAFAIDAGFQSDFEFEGKMVTAGIHYEF